KRHFCGHWLSPSDGWRYAAEVIEVAEYIPHPEYTNKTADNDVMLLLLKSTIEDFPVVNLNTNSSQPHVEDVVTVMGFGDTTVDDDVFEGSDVLKVAEVFVQSNEECEESEGNIWGGKLSYDDLVTNKMICAEAKKFDSCQADSGGPLVILGKNYTEDIQVGIVSWVFGCAHKHFPGIYARVSSYCEWMCEHVCEKSTNAPDSFQCGVSMTSI
ncbi:hypothetical protein ACHAXN_001513, partial [Cyclotella atomus]